MKTNNLMLALVVLVSFVQFAAAVNINIYHKGEEVVLWYKDGNNVEGCDVKLEQLDKIFARKDHKFIFVTTKGAKVDYVLSSDKENVGAALTREQIKKTEDDCQVADDGSTVTDTARRNRNRRVL